jgi:hypothetical protein
MNRLKPVPYDVAEGSDRLVVVVRCEPFEAPIVKASEIDARGFEIADATGSVLRIGNPPPRIRNDLRPITLVIVHEDGVDLHAIPSVPDRTTGRKSAEDRSLFEAMPERFLWHHGAISTAEELDGRPLAEILEGMGGTTVAVMCVPPVGPAASACARAKMLALPAGRKWTRSGTGLVIDSGSLDRPISIPEDVEEAVAAALGPGRVEARPPGEWRSQVAIRLPG